MKFGSHYKKVLVKSLEQVWTNVLKVLKKFFRIRFMNLDKGSSRVGSKSFHEVGTYLGEKFSRRPRYKCS